MLLVCVYIAQGVVCRHLNQLMVIEAIEPAVTTVHRVEVTIVIGKAYKCCSHALELLVGTAFRSDIVIDGLQPSHDSLVEIACSEACRDVVEEVLQIVQGVAAGDIATVMASHAIGHCYQQAVVAVDDCLCL